MISQAMIFSAGLGKRMLPLTENTPKPLIEINNKSLLKNNIEKLIKIVITHKKLASLFR